MEELERKIMDALKKNNIQYDIIEHEPVYTYSEMARQLEVKEAQTVKSLMLTTSSNQLILIVLSGDKRFDAKKIAKKVGTKKVSFAKPETVLDVAGCEVGCVPPFGHLKPISIYMDPQLMWSKEVYFNPGVHNKSVKIKAKYLKELCQPSTL